MATFRWKKGRMYTKHSKRYTDKQRAAYWKKKYFSCKHDLESLQGFKRR